MFFNYLKIFSTWVKAPQTGFGLPLAESKEVGVCTLRAPGRGAQADAHLLAHLGEKAELVLCEVWLQILTNSSPRP